MDHNTIQKARDIIGGLNPLKGDCGELCGKACCQSDDDEKGGMHLFPGEEALFPGADWYVLDRSGSIPLLTCVKPCPRDERPLACRIFPLTPVFSKGVWTVRMDARARSMCPLTASGVKGLDREFALAVREALRLIAGDPEGEAFLRMWQSLEEEFRNFTL